MKKTGLQLVFLLQNYLIPAVYTLKFTVYKLFSTTYKD